MSRLFTAVMAVVFGAGALSAQLRVVTSTTDLASIAKSVGGSRVSVTHVSEGYQDPHFAEAKPSFLLRMREADVFAFVGLDLEVGWMSLLVDGARNPKIRPGGAGHVDVSDAISVLDARAQADRSQGDVHPLGNPHYWLDPDNGRKIARLFDRKFSQLAPAHSAEFSRNRQEFETRLNAAEKDWQDELAVIKGKPVVAFHTSWKYLAEYTGMNIVGFMEPKPGVPPSPSHLAGLILQMKRTGARAIIMEPFYSRKDADFVASKTGATVVILPPSVGAIRGAPLNDYIQLMQYDIRLLASVLK
jgi:zinc/manganese transport system substrate-binding protein